MRRSIEEQVRGFTEPSSDKLLPDLPTGMQNVSTLVVGLYQTLVYFDWKIERNWRTFIRPGADAFLKHLAQFYEIVVYTDAWQTQEQYVDPLLDRLDENHYITHRLTRAATRYENGKRYLDLSKLNRDLRRVIYISGHARGSCLQPENCVEIKPWKNDDLNDTTLLELIPFLKSLSGQPDIRDTAKEFIERSKEHQSKKRQSEYPSFVPPSKRLETLDKVIHQDWNSLILSDFALEQQLHNARQELSHALFQRDVACRVIARLTKERDEARLLLAQAERQTPMSGATGNAVHAPAVSSGKGGPEEEDLGPSRKKARPGISADIIAQMTDCKLELSQQRKKRTVPSTLAPIADLELYTEICSYPLHKTNKPGILSVDIHYAKDIVATGGLDNNAVIFDRPSGQIISTLCGHSKAVTSVKIVPQDQSSVITASADKTVRLWQGSEDGNYDCRHVLRDHTAEVQAVTIHATNKYFVTASFDKSWCFYDLSSGLCLTQVGNCSGFGGYTSAAFHPDGLILGTGTTNAVAKIWDVKIQQSVAQFDGHTGPITTVCFSENGYFLATAAHDGVKLWDLRTLKNFRSFPSSDPHTPTNYVDFDHSGSYLAVANSDLRVYQVASVEAEWNCVKTLADLSGSGKTSTVKFGLDAKYIAVGSMDRNLQIFGLPVEDDGVAEL